MNATSIQVLIDEVNNLTNDTLQSSSVKRLVKHDRLLTVSGRWSMPVLRLFP